MKKMYLAAAGFFAAMAMTGSAFAAELTAEDVLANYLNATKNVTEANFTMDLNLDINIHETDTYRQIRLSQVDEEGETELPPVNESLQMSFTGDAAFKLDPITVGATVTTDTGMLAGQSTYEFYVVPLESGDAAFYLSTDDKVIGTQIPADAVSNLQSQLSQALAAASGSVITAEQLQNLPVDWTLETDQDVNGVNCHVVSTSFALSDMVTVAEASDPGEQGLSAISQQLGIELTYDDIRTYFNGLNLNVYLAADAATYLPVSVSLDLNGSTLSSELLEFVMSMTGANISGIGSMLAFDLTELSLNYDYDYSEPVSVTVPDSIIDSATIIPYEEFAEQISSALPAGTMDAVTGGAGEDAAA